MASGSTSGRTTGRTTREHSALHAGVIELATYVAIGRSMSSTRLDSLARARLGDSRRALGLDGFLLLLRDDNGGRLTIATSDGFPSERALDLASGLVEPSGLAEPGDGPSTGAEPRLFPDLEAEPGPFAGVWNAAQGSLAVLPLPAWDGRVLGYIVLLRHRKGEIAGHVISAFQQTAADLASVAAAADAQRDERPRPFASNVVVEHSELLLRVGQDIRRARRFEGALSIVLVHIDDLRQILERSGTHAGADVVTGIVDSILDLLRATDAVARLAGGRLAAILGECTRDNVVAVSEKLQRAAARMAPSGGSTVAISVGAATWQDGEDADELLAAAETCLERAIADGGNRLEVR